MTLRIPGSKPPPPFGRRTREGADPVKAPGRDDDQSLSRPAAPYRRVRLRTLGVDLSLFYEATFDELAPQFLVRHDEGGPFLSVGDPIGLLIQTERDATMREVQLRRAAAQERADSAEPLLLMVGRTPDNDRRTCRSDVLPLRTDDVAVDMLVGNSLEAVERRLVLRTLRRFKGDFRRTALALGVSNEEFCRKLSAILVPAPSDPFAI